MHSRFIAIYPNIWFNFDYLSNVNRVCVADASDVTNEIVLPTWKRNEW